MQASGRLPKDSTNSVSEQKSTDGGKSLQGKIYWKRETIDRRLLWEVVLTETNSIDFKKPRICAINCTSRIDIHIPDMSSLDFENPIAAQTTSFATNL